MPAKWYPFVMGFESEEFGPYMGVHGCVRARSPAKAFKAARRIQLKTGWPLMEFDPTPLEWPNWDRRAAKRRERQGLE